MPIPSLHPLPVNPTTGQAAPLASFRGSVAAATPASAAGGGVARETLKALQDVVWNEDEDDPDCLLCAEPLDLSDLNFKPCQCGMQICQFCYNKLLTSDSRCPGCRRPYDAKAVVYQPVDWEEIKRAKEKKTKRTKMIKQLNAMGRRHLLGVRIVMKNMVYVIGMKLPASVDEAIPILRSNDYFGQYGKISKVYFRDRTILTSTSVTTLTPSDASSSTGIYIVYVRREDAARAISALDGIPAPSGPSGQVLRATFGTTRYCDAFLRGLKCDSTGCVALHEWGGESDCFTRDDMETALTKPAEYDARQKLAQTQTAALSLKAVWPKSSTTEELLGYSALPNSAAWGKTLPISRPTPTRLTAHPIGTSRPVKADPPASSPLTSDISFPLPTRSPATPSAIKEKRKGLSAIAMARGRSTDSTQSGTTSSNQPSPRKKPIPLAPVTARNATVAPPGLSVPTPTENDSTIETLEETQEESASVESETGPSSASPAPQTPSRYTDLPPPPLTTEPICIHSPYEEPRLFSFPTSDPAFAFVLGSDEERTAAESSYQPTPFSKTLVGLAELGVFLPETVESNSPVERVSGIFQPFEARDEEESDPGPSRKDLVEHREAPRTISRFEFARPSSRSTGRGSSPFALMRSMEDGQGDGWGRSGQAQHGLPSSQLGQQFQEEYRDLAAQSRPFPGSLGSSEWWSGTDGFSLGSSGNGDFRREAKEARGVLPKSSRERDEYESGFGRYSQNNTPIHNGLFSPDHASRMHDDLAAGPPYAQSPHAFSHLHHAQQAHGHTHSQSPVGVGMMDGRMLFQRGQSPTPLGQWYRRF